MGKAPKRVRILLTDPSMEDWPLVQKWKEQGHEVDVAAPYYEPTDKEWVMIPKGLTEYDLILGPNCWMMTKALEKYLPLSLQAARERRYGNKEDKKGAIKQNQDATGIASEVRGTEAKDGDG